jgi:hypothetical protein
VNIRSTFDANADYRRLDIVALNSGSFIALKDTSSSPARAGAGLPAKRESAASAARGVIQD